MGEQESVSEQDELVVEECQSDILLTKKLRSVASLMPFLLLTQIVSFALVVWSFYEFIPHSTFLAWGGFLSVTSLPFAVWAVRNRIARRRHLQGFKSADTLGNAKHLRRLQIGAFLNGVAWGVALPVIMSTGSEEMKLLLAPVILVNIIAGAIVLGALPVAAAMFMIPLVGFGAYALSLEAQGALVIGMYATLAFVAVTTSVLVQFYARFFSNQLVQLREVINISETKSELLNTLESTSSDWIWETDESGSLTRFPEQMLPSTDSTESLKLAEYLRRVTMIKGTQYQELTDSLNNGRTFNEVLLSLHWGAGERWIRFCGEPQTGEAGEFKGFRGTGCDVTSERLAEERIVKLTESDTLTGILNRNAFSDRLAQAVANLERYGRPFSVMYLDLDNFRLVNDTRGHLAGDRLLVEASERIADEVREVDSIARLGGDEFAVLMEDQGDAGSAARLASRIIGEVGKPYSIDDEEFRIGISIGIALAPLNGTRPDQLLRNADLALYRAKADGRGLFRFFENSMDAELRERRMLEVELRDAAANDELVLHFQPLVDAKTHKVVSMESLIRWQHPIRGLLSPFEFIELAERANLIAEIGAWTLNRACETARNWPSHVIVAVNLSAHHFMQSDIVNEVKEALERNGFPAQRLELEITESLLIHNSDAVVDKLEKLKALGVSVAMDDFGTGYSSLSYLMSVPFDKLKIDKSFVDEVTVKETGRKIVKMITTLGKELDLKITAEGVETAEQAEFLTNVGCDTLQGYHFSRPLPEEKLGLYFLEQSGVQKQLNAAAGQAGQQATVSQNAVG